MQIATCDMQARDRGFVLEMPHPASGKEALRAAWVTSGQSVIDWIALTELKRDPAKLLMSCIDSTADTGRKLIEDLKTTGIYGAKDPYQPVGKRHLASSHTTTHLNLMSCNF